MLPIELIKSRWHYIVILAIIIQSIKTYYSSRDLRNRDAYSAIRRAKSYSCKRELEEFAIRLLNDNMYPKQLKRSCKLDVTKERIFKVGCVSNSNQNLVRIDDKIETRSTCLSLCFSYGHSHGGFMAASGSCYCGDTTFQNNKPKDYHDCLNDEFDWFRVNNGIYYKSNKLLTNSKTSHFSQIKIAFLLSLSGRTYLHVQQLLRYIYSDKHIYFIHVDERDDYLFNQLVSLEKTHRNIIVSRSRFITIWGGPSLLRMIINAISQLSKHDWDYLINLSESDFPIKPLESLEEYLGNRARSIHLKEHNIRGYNFIKKQGLNRNFYQCDNHAWRMGNRRLPGGIIYSGGSDWFALPRDFCRYLIDNLDENHGLVKPLLHVFNFTLLPAESFFHTLALNSEFCHRVSDTNLRITNWNRKQGCKCQHKDVVDWCGCSPLVYRMSDWNKLKQTRFSENLFFTRKFDPRISSSIINKVINNLILNPLDKSIDNDTRFWQNLYSADEIVKEDSNSEILQQFGFFAIQSGWPICFASRNILAHDSGLKLNYVDIHFNHDRFVGYIYHYCSKSMCIQLLVKKNNHAHLDNYNDNCFNSVASSLKVIEVNQGFDTGERMFRSYLPLSYSSNIVVYHEWLVDPCRKRSNNSTNELLFSITNPKNRLELTQNVKFRKTLKPTRLTLAHRLNLSKPLISGVWNLRISLGDQECLNYRYLVFDPSTFTEGKLDQKEFNKFYFVSDQCVVTKSNINDLKCKSCLNSEWSSLSKPIPSIYDHN